MFELVDRVELYPEFLPWCGGAQRARDARRRQDGAHRHRLPGVRAHFTTDNVNRAGESIVITLRDGPFRHLHGEWRFSRARARRLQGRIRARLRVRDAAARDASSDRCSVTSRTRSSTRSSAAPTPSIAGRVVIVTVVWATPGGAGHRPRRACRRARRSPTPCARRASSRNTDSTRDAAGSRVYGARGRRATRCSRTATASKSYAAARRRSEGRAGARAPATSPPLSSRPARQR